MFMPFLEARFSKGFSLFEMIVVMTIIGILSSISLPAFNAWMSDAKVKSASQQIISGIRLAQSEALKSGQHTQFFLSSVTPAAGATVSSSGKNWGVQTMNMLTPDTVDTLVQSRVMAGQYPQLKIEANTAVLTFNSIGRITNIGQNAQLDISHPIADKRLRIFVSVTGAMRLCNPDKSRVSAPDGC